MNLVCDVKLPDGRTCGNDSSKSPAALGRHKWFTHQIRGTAHMSLAEKRKLAESPEASEAGPVLCFYCPATFAKVRGRSRHITEIHPGKPKYGVALPVLALDEISTIKPKKGRKANAPSRDQEPQTLTFTKEEFAFQQAVANAAGYLQAKADELAGRDGYVSTDFTRQCFEILHRQTLR